MLPRDIWRGTVDLAALAMAAVMVTAVFGMVPVAATGPGPATDAGSAGELSTVDRAELSDTHDPAEVSIAEELEDVEGTETVFLRLEPAAVEHVEDEEAVVQALQEHAEETQPRVIRGVENLQGAKVQNRFWIMNAVLVEVDTEETDIEDLAEIPGVERIHPNYDVDLIEPEASGSAEASEVDPDDYDDLTWGLEKINAPDVWEEFDTKGEDVKVAIMDTGVHIDHPDLDLYTEDPDDPTYPGGWAEFDEDGEEIEDSEPRDDNGHGSHVAGTVAGPTEPDNDDIPGYGVAPGADLIASPILGDDSGTVAAIAAAIEWGVEEGADVMNHSWGPDGLEEGECTSFDGDIAEPVHNAHMAGSYQVGSTGNDGEDTAGVPAIVYSAMASGALAPDDEVADFSSGLLVDTEECWDGWDQPDDWPDEYIVPDLVAPGDDVWSAWDGNWEGGGGPFSPCTDDELYCEIGGTSMSAPHKAGSLAVLLSLTDGEASFEDMEEALKDTAWKPDDWDEEDDAMYNIGEKDSRYGHGIIDLHAAADQLADESFTTVEANATVGVADADGEDALEFAVEVTEDGDPVNNAVVIAEHDGTDIAFDDGEKETDQDGTVEFEATSTEAQEDVTFTFTEEDSGASAEATGTFDPIEVVDRVEIEPAEDQTIEAGAEIAFEATAYDEEDNVVEDEDGNFTWAAEGGAIGDAGLFAETDVGTYNVTAELENVSSEATMVTVEPGDVDAVEIDPAEDREIESGETIDFAAVAFDAYDNVVEDDDTAFAWNATEDGNISGDGLFGETALGHYDVTATFDEVTSNATTVTVDHPCEAEGGPGDVNDDGAVWSLDATTALQLIAAGDYHECADLTLDGDVTPSDVTHIQQIIVKHADQPEP